LQRLVLAYTDGKHSLYLNDQFIKDSAWLMASELLAVGVDISFAPVVDADDCMSQVIGDRSFSKNIHLVSKLGQLYISGMHEAGMAATLKHFPGHGAVQADSHLALPVDKRTLDQVWDSDMVPFRELLPISEGVMPAHILFDQIDSMPVGFSTYWLQKMLREKMKYKGIIFSDDLSMEGAAIAGEHSERAVAALTAGCDAVVVCNNSQKAREVLTCLEERRWPINNRLALMRANSIRDVYSIEQLRKTDRWNKSVENLHELGD
jgi:beta-N-acetylhexosaminidase